MTADGQESSLRKPMVTSVPVGAPPPEGQTGSTVKPIPADLGVDLAALDWQRSGAGHGSFEVAFVAGRLDGTGPEETGDAGRADWVLLRVTGDQEGRVLVYDRNEWECFLDGASHGEFDLPG
jgi:hypothetical protein